MNIRHPRRQSGAILVISAVVLVVLLGAAALALDLGRVFVQQTEMQNAADAAARSGAWELDGRPGARTRAEEAARDMLRHRGHFSRSPELLEQLAYDAGSHESSPIVFYSWIGSADDPPVHNPATYCAQKLGGQWLADRARCLSTDDVSARYMEIWLDPARAGDADAYTVDLLFLPVLEVLGDEVARFATVSARAVAGRSFFVCEYAPMVLCNPSESAPKSFAQAVSDGDINPGDVWPLSQKRDQGNQGSVWAPGNFGLLQPKVGGEYDSGAKVVGEHVGDPARQECTTPWVHTQTGNIQSHPVWGWNTRFGEYQKGGFSEADYPPAPVIQEYPQPNGSHLTPSQYWNKFHSYHSGYSPYSSLPSEWSDGMTWWDIYNWEIEKGYPPCNDTVAPIEHGIPGEWKGGTCPGPDDVPMDLRERSGSEPERRILFVAVVDCLAQDLRGSMEVFSGTFAKFFIMNKAVSAGSSPDYVVEFVGLAGIDDTEYFVEVQLYE